MVQVKGEWKMLVQHKLLFTFTKALAVGQRTFQFATRFVNIALHDNADIILKSLTVRRKNTKDFTV